MQLKVKELLTISGSIAALQGAKVEVHTAFKLRKFIKAAVAEINEIDEARRDLIKQYGALVPKSGGQYRVTDENSKVYDEAWEKMLAEEVTLPMITVKVSTLANAGLTMGDIANLDFILDQQDEGTVISDLPTGKDLPN